MEKLNAPTGSVSLSIASTFTCLMGVKLGLPDFTCRLFSALVRIATLIINVANFKLMLCVLGFHVISQAAAVANDQ